MDPYSTLNVEKDATDAEIKKAYRKLAAQHHPDKGGDEETFKRISEAYSLINSQEKRNNHNGSYQFNDFGDVFGGFGEIFEGFFGPHRTHRQERSRPQTDEEIMFDFKISLAKIKQGIVQEFIFERNVACTPCSGIGGKNKRSCTSCNGSGVKMSRIGPMIQQMTCRLCYGSGYSFEEQCVKCKGSGMTKERDSIKFTVKGE